MVSATTYTLVGVVNKFLTVLLNVLVWDKHSTPFGIFSVCVCLLAGSFYQQAPKREEATNRKNGGAHQQADKDVEAQQPFLQKK